MTKDEERLLNIDLCARIPYGVKIKYLPDDRLDGIKLPYLNYGLTVLQWGNISYRAHIKHIRPYLRPLSTMTEEEKKEFLQICPSIVDVNTIYGFDCNDFEQFAKVEDFLLRHHFDYRGLIEKGLAVAATPDMYKTNKS